MTKHIYITQQDRALLFRLLASTSHPDQASLSKKLQGAVVVSAHGILPHIVTLDSRVRIKDLDTGRSGEYTLVLPGASNTVQGAISVLAPAGVAILGQGEDDIVEWLAPAGRKRFCIDHVMYQPEYSSRFPWAEPLPAGQSARVS